MAIDLCLEKGLYLASSPHPDIQDRENCGLGLIESLCHSLYGLLLVLIRVGLTLDPAEELVKALEQAFLQEFLVRFFEVIIISVDVERLNKGEQLGEVYGVDLDAAV